MILSLITILTTQNAKSFLENESYLQTLTLMKSQLKEFKRLSLNTELLSTFYYSFFNFIFAICY